MAANDNRQKITVEALLRLKRHERPEGDFWQSFEQDFQRRRLHALVERPDWRNWFFVPALKIVGVALPALLMMGVAYIWYADPGQSPHAPQLASASEGSEAVPEPLVVAASTASAPDRMPVDLDTRGASNQFVVDAFRSDSGPSARFRKVLYTPAIQLSSPAGAVYVRDNLSSSTYKVTTADAKLGRNF